MIEIDLLDADGVIISIAAVDESFWSTSSAQASALAAQHGFALYVPGGTYNKPERNIYALGDIQNWMASAPSLKLPVTQKYQPPASWTIGLVVLGGLGLAALAWAATRTKRPR